MSDFYGQGGMSPDVLNQLPKGQDFDKELLESAEKNKQYVRQLEIEKEQDYNRQFDVSSKLYRILNKFTDIKSWFTGTKTPVVYIYDCNKTMNHPPNPSITHAIDYNKAAEYGIDNIEKEKDYAEKARMIANDLMIFYGNVFGRNSIDNIGGSIHLYINYGPYNNSDWYNYEGAKQKFHANIGNGEVPPYPINNTQFLNFAGSPAYLCHEISHGITFSEQRFFYTNKEESGPLNETISDIFAIMFQHWLYREKVPPAEANWKMGVEVIIGNTNKIKCVRSLKDPTSTDCYEPKTSDSYIPIDSSFKYNLYYYMGAPSKAFYLAVTNINAIRSQQKKPDCHSFERAGKIWYDAITDKTSKDQYNFSEFAGVTKRVAQRRYGQKYAIAVADAWNAVGIQLPAGV